MSTILERQNNHLKKNKQISANNTLFVVYLYVVFVI